MSARSIAASASAARWSGRSRRKALSPAALDAALDYIRDDPQIWEVILTGGDPLVLSPRRLREVMKRLGGHRPRQGACASIPAFRSPSPRAITAELVRALKVKGKAIYVALHVNHARELTAAARAACARLADAGIPLLGQSVLLAGVNDTPETMSDLMRALGRMPDQTVLSASRRSRARHGASAHRHRSRAGFDAWLARAALGSVPAGLCA